MLLLIIGAPNLIAQSLSEIIGRFKHDLSVEIIYSKEVKDSWSSVTYELCGDSTQTTNYVQLLYKEFSKYPEDYFILSGIKKIVLGRQLTFSGQNRAGIPDPYRYALYLSIDGAYGDSSQTYLIHVMHHELNHCAEYAMWKDMYYKWSDWSSCNPGYFQYKNGGASAYQYLSVDWYSMTHPEPGFVNLYSTTGQEEDRSEIMALIMSDEEREYLIKYSHDDQVLKKKIQLMLGNLNTFSQRTDNYWDKVMSEVIKEKND